MYIFTSDDGFDRTLPKLALHHGQHSDTFHPADAFFSSDYHILSFFLSFSSLAIAG